MYSSSMTAPSIRSEQAAVRRCRPLQSPSRQERAAAAQGRRLLQTLQSFERAAVARRRRPLQALSSFEPPSEQAASSSNPRHSEEHPQLGRPVQLISPHPFLLAPADMWRSGFMSVRTSGHGRGRGKAEKVAEKIEPRVILMSIADIGPKSGSSMIPITRSSLLPLLVAVVDNKHGHRPSTVGLRSHRRNLHLRCCLELGPNRERQRACQRAALRLCETTLPDSPVLPAAKSTPRRH
ncbi:hypothetical protein R3P38DRAFT_3545174 [Favolaschia claudopus]|uniref:Uncharacterized protein n=1 Tax=Favolaschia claudopus TaxID=2862362 RepID=A0AAW0DW73_9AGAR